MSKKNKRPKLRTIAEEWTDYANHIFRGMGVSDTQYRETQKAFYAGFTALMFQIRQIDDGVPDEVAAEHLSCLEIECKLFNEVQKRLGTKPEQN